MANNSTAETTYKVGDKQDEPVAVGADTLLDGEDALPPEDVVGEQIADHWRRMLRQRRRRVSQKSELPESRA